MIIDGIRGGAEIEVFKAAIGEQFKTIAIQIPDERRFELLKLRKRSDAPLTWEEFKRRDQREGRWGISEALDEADFILYNTGTLDELKESFIELLNFIKTLTGDTNTT